MKNDGFFIYQGGSYMRVVQSGQRRKLSPYNQRRNATSFNTREHAEQVARNFGCKFEPGMAKIVEFRDGKEIV